MGELSNGDEPLRSGGGPPFRAQQRRGRSDLVSCSVRTVVRAVGKVLLTFGLLLLLFVAYQLWGTGLYQARAQSDLKDKFDRQVSHQTVGNAPTAGPSSTAPDGPATTTQPPAAQLAPGDGDPVGIIKIPKIGVDQVVVEGTSVPDLRKGPGHYPESPLPGQLGNAAIAGHRTTYGAPFGDLDQLSKNDVISIQTLAGTWHYVLTDAPFAVSPDQTEVLLPTIESGQQIATLTLTTCNPKYSASQRLVVKARLTEPPLPAPKQQTKLTGLSGTPESRTPAVVWGLIAAAVGGLWWFTFHRYPRWFIWFAGVVPFLAVLFVFYTYLERVLPNNF
jgi:sortase A